MKSRLGIPVAFLLAMLGWMTAGAEAASRSADGIWNEVPATAALAGSVADDGFDTPGSRHFQLDDLALFRVLRSAPLEFTDGARAVLTLPLPDGTYARFAVVESPVLSSTLADALPELRTYSAQGLDDPTATARLSRTSLGFHAIIVTPDDFVFIGRASGAASGDTYGSVSRKELPAPDGISCAVDESGAAQLLSPRSPESLAPSGLRTLSLAIATTGEFTAFYGGTAATQAAVVQHVNQVNAIYERELSMRFRITCLTMYANRTTDPFTNPESVDGLLLTQTDEALDASCGASVWQVGHLFHARAGSGNVGVGRAQIGSACGGMKGRAASTATRPDLPWFVVDLLAHELAHQFGANHTYNSTSGGCVERFGDAAYEIGAGTTIMAYACAGCGAGEDPPGCADAYFHTHSFDEITSFLEVTGCGTATNTGNRPPVIGAGPDRTIPRGTPFTLTATGNDLDGDFLTWTWEEHDLGAASPPLNGTVSGPLFRSLPPSGNRSRTFPNLSDLLAGRPTPFEILPTTDRTLSFRVAARDNRSGGGTVAYDTAVLTVRGEPFRLLSPNGGQVVNASSPLDVTWQVGGGNVARNVNIFLSTDGGQTFPVTLAANVPNDGAHRVTLPSVQADETRARIRVEGAGNIFFDVSDADFVVRRAVQRIVIDAPAQVTVDAAGGAVIPVKGFISGLCGIDVGDVTVGVQALDGSAVVTSNLTTLRQSMVAFISGTITVTSVARCPATVRIEVNVGGRCDAPAYGSLDVIVRDASLPAVVTRAQGGAVGPSGTYTLPFSATLNDNLRFDAGQVVVTVTNPTQNAVVRRPVYTAQQVGPKRVEVAGTVGISNLTGGTATIRVEVGGTDLCGNPGSDAEEVQVVDVSLPDGASAAFAGDTGPVLATAFLGLRPNPLFGRTTLAFALVRAARVTLEVYSPAGTRVRTVAASPFEAGRHQVAWDGRDDAGRRLTPGMYFVRFAADGVTRTEKAVLLP